MVHHKHLVFVDWLFIPIAKQRQKNKTKKKFSSKTNIKQQTKQTNKTHIRQDSSVSINKNTKTGFTCNTFTIMSCITIKRVSNCGVRGGDTSSKTTSLIYVSYVFVLIFGYYCI